MKKLFSYALILVAIVADVNAQQLLTPSYSFSHKKTAYVTLTDGKEIKGTLDDIDRNKNLIEFVRIIDESGQKHKLNAEAVKFMYLPPSGMDNLSKQADFLTDATKWNDEKLDQDLLNQGYVYFELTQVIIRKESTPLLMQLLNPSFSKKVKIYHDPNANETASVGVAGIKVAGGDDKSYYVQTGDAPAYRLEKKNYADEFKKLWGSCDAVINKYPSMKWSEFLKHVTDYTECN